jgi:hypothetical protein
MSKFEINGKTYNSAPFTFKNICKLESLGATLAGEKNMTLLAAYLAICMKSTFDKAADEIEAHVIGGGELKEIGDVIGAEVDASDFFQALKDKAEPEEPEQPKTKTKVKAE